MRRATELAAFVALSMCAFGVHAEPYAYATTFDTGPGELSSRLVQIDLATGSVRSLGRISYSDVEGLAMAPEGTLYGVSDTPPKTLLTVDTSFGRGSAVGSGSGNLGFASTAPLDFGLAFTCDGRLWMSSDSTGNLWEVNRNTGAARLVGSMGANISGLAGTANGLYGIGIEATRGLYKINVDTAAVTRVGPAINSIAPYVDAGMDVDSSGNLWAVLDYNLPPDSRPGDAGKLSDLVKINPQTGAYTYVAKTLIEVEGLAIGRPPACAAAGSGQIPAIPVNSLQFLLMLGMMVLGLGLVRVHLSQR
jgi:hypothetical protein